MGLDRAQREILRRALGAAVVRRIGGVDVALLRLELDEDTSGLDEVTSHVAALESRAAIFAVFAAPKGRVHVVARARAPWIDVGRVLAAVGGGGHPAAASVTRKGESADAIVAAIVAAIEADPPRPSRVRDLMSSPVHTVAPAATLRELAATLGAWRHTGAPVVEEGRLVGVVSRRDVEAADAAGDLDRPVASRMRRRVVTTTPDAPLDDALALMQAEDVGRLPVLDAGRLAGIVTRSDVLRALYAEAKAPPGA
jgi:tRNA nucleotidyltransferase (CCA-adding enzyme)